jgi:hypothetical protein
MKPETAEHRDKAHRCLAGAKTIAAAELPAVTAREAYLAVHHAAEAYIFERTDKAAKTHRGVRSQFARESPASDANSLPFSPRSTNSKRSPVTASVPPATRSRRTMRLPRSTRPGASSMPLPSCSQVKYALRACEEMESDTSSANLTLVVPWGKPGPIRIYTQ